MEDEEEEKKGGITTAKLGNIVRHLLPPTAHSEGWDRGEKPIILNNGERQR